MDDADNTSYRNVNIHEFSTKPNLTYNPSGMHSLLLQPGSFGIVRGVCLVVVSVLGASLNVFMIVAIVPNRRLRTVRNMLLAHLGGVGLLSSVSTTIYPALATFHGSWLGGVLMCQAYSYISCLLTSVSVWTIAALSWDKYQTIASPLHHSLGATLRKMLPCFTVLWLCGIVLLLPPLFGANEFFLYSTMGICDLNVSSAAGRWYIFMLVLLSFIVPFCLMIYCYTHIFRIARTQSSRIAATMLRMVHVIQAPIAPCSHGSHSLRGIKAMGTIFQLIGSFVLTYLPYATIVIYEIIFAVHANAILVSIATTLFLAAPFTHATIYGVKNQILRSSFRRYARRKVQHCCTKDNRRSNSIRSLARKPSTAIKMSIKCTVKSDEKQCILQRTVYCQSKPLDDQIEAYENKASSLPRPYSFEITGNTNNWPPPRPTDITLGDCCSQYRDTEQIKLVPFFNVQDISYLQSDYVSRNSSQQTGTYSDNSIKDSTLIDSRIETILKYSHEQCEHSSFGELPDDESDSDTLHDELIQLYPIKDIMNEFDSRQSNKKTRQGSDKLKYGLRKKKSKRQWQITDREDISIYSVEHIEAESGFEQQFHVDMSQACSFLPVTD